MKISCLKISVLLLAIAAISMPALAGTPTVRRPGTRALSQSAALPAALRPALYRALAKDAEPAYDVSTKGCATLLKQKLKACFNSDGAHFTGADSPLTLHLVAFGRGGAFTSARAVQPEISGNRVSYAHGNLTAWWQVLPMGFEQGFTIAKRPSGHGELTLALAASRQDAGAPKDGTLAWGKMRYGRLVVTDARGKVIPAAIKSKGDRVMIAVNDAHAVYPLTVDPLVWMEQEISSSDGASGDDFGWSVAIDGTTALVGAIAATAANGQSGPGAAYVFTESNGTWTQTAKLVASDGEPGDAFGSSVALDGTTALIGADTATVNGNFWQGAAYVFTESDGTWSQTQKLTASDGEAFDNFGWAVALDGTTALIGSINATVNGNYSQGAVYIFAESDGTWTQSQKLTASDGAEGDRFGISLTLSGPTALIGAYFATINGNPYQGAAYVFTNSNGTWTQTQKLTATDGAAYDEFGGSVALDDTTALIGAPQATVNGNQYQGAAYIFTESDGTWTQTQKLVASDGATDDYFGWSAALKGTTALIGEDLYILNKGAAYAFTESDGAWTQTQELIASNGTEGDSFGSSVALSGTTALVGADLATVNDNVQQGAAYFYGESDLGLNVSAPQSVGQGQQYTSQTIATNNASAASPAVTATVTVPAATSFVSASASQGTCSEDSGVVSCDFGQINGNAGTATANVTLKAVGNPGTTIENTASVSKTTPALTASAPTVISQTTSCPTGYTTYSGMLAANGRVRGPSYAAPAGEENAILYAPAGFKLYARVDNSEWGSRRQQGFPGTEVHRWGPGGTYAWGVKAGDTGGAFTFCLLHP